MTYDAGLSWLGGARGPARGRVARRVERNPVMIVVREREAASTAVPRPELLIMDPQGGAQPFAAMSVSTERRVRTGTPVPPFVV